MTTDPPPSPQRKGNRSEWWPLVAALAASLALGETYAVHDILTTTPRNTGDWLIGVLAAGPALAGVIFIPLLIIGGLIAMMRFPR